MNSIDLVIFDMDETLVASGEIWRAAEMRTYGYLDCPYSPEAAAAYKGLNAMDVGRTIHSFCKPESITADECGRMLREWLMEGFRGPVRPMPGADALVRHLHGKVDMAVASGSPLPAIQSVLQRLGWSECFRVIVSSEEVARGKPAPDVFLEAARRADHSPEHALVIEDSAHGVKAARNAGMRCFAVPSTDDPSIAQQADRSFSSLSDMVDLW